MIKKHIPNLILPLMLLLIIGACFVIRYFVYSDKAAFAVITVNLEEYGRYEIDIDRDIDVYSDGGHINRVSIKEGCVFVYESDCKGHDCINQGRISKSGESIICLPHKVVLTIEGGKEEGPDIVVH